MSFKMDSQSYKDLNIFIGSSTEDPVFNMFRATRTLGGKEKIREMMGNPSSDISFLTRRKEAIQYFYHREIVLKIKSEQLDLIEHYLNFNKAYSRNNLLDSLVDFVQNRSGDDYYRIKTGLGHLIRLLNYLDDFVKSNLSEGAPEYLKTLGEKIEEIMSLNGLKGARKLNEKKLKFYQVSKLDHAFRGKEKNELKALLELVYELDAFETLSNASRKLGLCFPDYSASNGVRVTLTGIFHPAIGKPVKNDMLLKSEENITFLTGSNMAGKSSLLKSLGLVIYLSHLGFPVPAEKMETTIFSGLLTTINLPDNMGQGLSHYYTEVKRVKEAVSSLLENDHMFIIFDELFRGTNVKDAFDASLLIISELSQISNSIFFISTHIVELADELRKFENISFKYLDTFFKQEHPVFTYQLKEGVSKERLGMYIIQQEGIIDIIRKVSLKQKTAASL
ncbi:MutS-related protein [Pedobacter steynii]|uniref:DNA mismatch repair proteins mutS family domain-containing protein n=1 Tax=Pedobacter steynii TaxID=430522 RepID=A0A1D7QB28_9SPHI|nr:hypothetical protein [Pedobacter steynii]AOM75898.1 hypothetical protein BFS30_01145 [Pedobacter steynii]